MSKWGKRIEFSKGEVQALLNASSGELARQISQQRINPDLVTVVEKTSKVLAKFALPEVPKEAEGK
jgi:hypothetical protein